MADSTIAVDDGTLKKARMRALEEGTSVNAVLRGCFEGSAGREQVEVTRRIVAVSHEWVSGSRPGKWKREDAYGDCVS